MKILSTIILIAISFVGFAATVDDVGVPPEPSYPPSLGEWTMTSSCVAINDNGEAACQAVAAGQTVRCGFRGIKRCGSLVKQVYRWDGLQLTLMSSPAADSDVPTVINNEGAIGGYDYVGQIYPNSGGNGRIWQAPGVVENKQYIVVDLNDNGDYILETAENIGGYLTYSTEVYDVNDDPISVPGVRVRTSDINEEGVMVGSQVLQSFSNNYPDDEIPDVSGVGWLLNQAEIDVIDIDEAGLLDIDGDRLWPFRFIRPPSYLGSTRTVLFDLNKFGEHVGVVLYSSIGSSALFASKLGKTVVDGLTYPWRFNLPGPAKTIINNQNTVFAGLNDYGDVSGNRAGVPTVWLKTGVTEVKEFVINDLIPEDSGYTVTSAGDINNNRQVVAGCTNANGEQRGCIINLDIAVPAAAKKPFVQIDNINRHDEINGLISINATAVDRDGFIHRVIFKVDATRIAVDKTAPYHTTFDTSTLSVGEHTLKVIAVDNERNRTVARERVNVIATK